MPRQTKRGRKLDRKKRAKYRPRKKFKKSLAGEGDWNRKKYRKGRKKRKKKCIFEL